MTEPAKFLPVAAKAMDLASQIIHERLPAVVSAKGDRDMVSDIDVHTADPQLKLGTTTARPSSFPAAIAW